MLSRQLAVLGALTLMFGRTLEGQALSVIPDSAARRLLASARSLRCHFGYGVVHRLDSLPPKPVATNANDYGNPEVYDNIDRVKRTARAIGNVGAVDVGVASSDDVLSFVEVTPSGNMVITTVFAKLVPGSWRQLLATTTRHMLFPPIVVSQYYGRCEVLFG